jgi:hypothetical protein
MVELTTTVGLAIFSSALTASIVLYWVDSKDRIDFNTPYGQTLPWTVALIGAGVFTFAEAGIVGVMATLAGAIFFGYINQQTKKLRENP